MQMTATLEFFAHGNTKRRMREIRSETPTIEFHASDVRTLIWS